MGRQRTIDDAAFWRSPRMAGRTQEDRSTLFYLLTSPFSNIIGVYQIVPRIAASEIGWDTESQLIPVVKRLCDAGFLEYDDDSGYVWVKIWWDNNSASMSVGVSLRQKTYDQIRAMPESWQLPFLRDFLARLPSDKKGVNLRAMVETDLGVDLRLGGGGQGVNRVSVRGDQGACRNTDEGSDLSSSNGFTGSGQGADMVSTGSEHGVDRSAGNTTTNSNFISNTTTGPGGLRFPDWIASADQIGAARLLAHMAPYEAQPLVEEWAMRIRRKEIRGQPLNYLAGLIGRHKSGEFVPTQPESSSPAKQSAQTSGAESHSVDALLKAFAEQHGWRLADGAK